MFLICTEIVSIKGRQIFGGTKILEEEILLWQFADGTSFSLDSKRKSFHACVQQFASMSGLNMNFEKTMVVWMGSREHTHTHTHLSLIHI